MDIKTLSGLSKTTRQLGWLGIIRLGLVQTALGAMVVITTSTLNRVMVVELAMAAVLPGLLVALHYAVQITRPRMGHSSDVQRRRTPWIIGGVLTLAIGTIGAAMATALMATSFWLGIVSASIAFVLIGFGVGASGTSLLALLASRVDEYRRPAAATLVWVMMIAGFVVTAGVAGSFLDPFSMQRLVVITAIVAGIAVVLALLAVWGIEKNTTPQTVDSASSATPFRQALSETWQDRKARQFTVFVFVSMLAYSAQDLILEPFAGAVFGFSPGESTQLAGVQHGGVLLGMIFVAIVGTQLAKRRGVSLRWWCVGGCIASAIALTVLALGGQVGAEFPLKQAVFALGLANGVFAVAAIGSMMSLASSGDGKSREGIRMGVWGAAQAVAFAAGGFAGTAAIDIARTLVSSISVAYAGVFLLQAILFLVAAHLAFNLGSYQRTRNTMNISEQPS